MAPGVAINVAQCTGGTLADLGGCDLLGDSDDGNNYAAVRMYAVELEPNSPTNLRVFKVEGIPDCRYILKQIPLNSLPADHPCRLPGVVVNDPKVTDGTQNFPQRQYLNVTPMLPTNVTEVFDASGKKPLGLPKMLIQPRYRAQAINGYTFQALFGVADPDIRFRKTFTVEFDISDFNLAGFALGCGVHQTVTPDHPNGPLPFNQWDIGTVVSERYASVGGPKGIVKNTTHRRATVPGRARRHDDQQGVLQPDAEGRHALVHVFVQHGTRRGQAGQEQQVRARRPVSSIRRR